MDPLCSLLSTPMPWSLSRPRAHYVKTDAARITKLYVKMFQDEYWKPIYLGAKRSKVEVTRHKNIAGVGLCTLASAASVLASCRSAGDGVELWDALAALRVSRHHLYDVRRHSPMVAVGRETGADPQPAVGRQVRAHARRVDGVRHVDVAWHLAVDRVADAGQRVVALDANQQLVGRQLNADVVRMIVAPTQIHHHLQHLISVVCVHVNVSKMQSEMADVAPGRLLV